MKSLIFFTVIFLIFMPKDALADSVKVRITPDGFIPAELEINSGSEVVFINEDTNPRWPASDVHPTHLIYPQFDPKKEIKPQENWTFKFQKAGNFKFHDHLLPHQKGIIKVSGYQKESLISKLQKQFFDFFQNLKEMFLKQGINEEEFKSLEDSEQIEFLKNYAKKKGAKSTWDFLKKTFTEQEGGTGKVHDLAHLTGSLVFEYEGLEGIKICTPTFAFGCYHGLLDQAFSQSLEKINKAEEGCNTLGMGGPAASCIHGIGHGVASFHQTSSLSEALEDCEKLKNGVEYCYDGVFMEFARNAAPNFYKKSDPLFPCNTLDQRFTFACGRNQPNMLLGRFNLTTDEIIKLCSDSADQPFKEGCFDSIGFIAAARSLGKADLISLECNKILDDQFRLRCARSAAGELIFQNMDSWQTESLNICNNLDQSLQEDCQSYIENIKKDYSRN